MSAKEERALHLEIHRMTRMNGEMAARNAALESECARLRMVFKHDNAQLVAKCDALLQKCADYQAAEHGMLAKLQMERQSMVEAMQREQNETLTYLQEKMQQKTCEQRQTALNEITTMKQILEAQYADTIGKKTQELDAAKQKLDAAKQNLETQYADTIGKKTQELDAVKQNLEAQYADTIGKKTQDLDAAKQKLEAQYADTIGKKTQELDAVKKNLEAQYADTIGKKTQELDAAKQKLADELASEKKARIQREEEHVAYFWDRVEEINNLKTAKMQKWEEDKRIFQEEWQQRLDQAKKQQIHVEKQLELEKEERIHAETQMNHYMSIVNEQKRQMEKEQNEMAVVTEKRCEDRIKALTLQLIKTVSFSQISNAIAANYAHAQLICNLGFKDKRVLIYSHYSDRDEVESYNYLTLQHMEDRFDYVVVLTNCPNKWDLPNPNYNKFHVLGYNFKSDFRNYAVFIMQTAKTLVHASQLCLMNDSCVIVDVLAYERCMKHLFEPVVAHDFVGITSSHEGVYHLQSYFICFNTTSVIKAVVNYFEVHGLPINHNASISVYELGITQHLVNQGFTSYAMVSNAEMQFPLNTTYCKWSAVLQHTGIIKRQHLLKQYPLRFAMTDYNIALIANKFSENKHFIHYLKYHGINLD